MEEELSAIRTWLGQGSINIFGMPFAGKDTQGGALADLLDAELLGGGTILRNGIIPPHVQKIMDNGGLIPTEDYLHIVMPFLSHERLEGKPLLLSSVGRWHGEEHGVMQATKAAGHPIQAVILLTVSEDVARERHDNLSREDRGNRADDAPGVFEKRLHEFHEKTLPVIEFYRDHGLLIEIDGDQKPVAVTNDIIEQLAKRTKQLA
jgi:adenylate kinase